MKNQHIQVINQGINRRHFSVLIVIFLGSLFFRIHNLGVESIWLDEGFSVYFAKLSLSEIFFTPEGNPPLYYSFLHLWTMLFGYSEYAIRISSALFGIVSIIMIYMVAKHLFDKETAVLSALLLGLSVVHIEYAQEARTYSLSSLLTLFSMYFFIKLLTINTYKNLIGYVFFSILLMYSHICGFYIIISQNICFISIFLLFKEDYTLNHKQWILGQLILLILFIPWISIFLSNVLIWQGPGSQDWVTKPSLGTILNAFIQFSGNTRVYVLMIVLVILSPLSISKNGFIGSNVGWRNISQYIESYRWKIRLQNTDKIYILFLWLLIPILIPFIVSQFSVLSVPIFKIRYILVASLAFYILVAKGISNINNKLIKSVTISVIIAFSLLSIWRYHTSLHKEQWREAVKYIDTNVHSGDLLLFNAGIQDLVYNYYSQRDLPLKKSYPETTRNVDDVNIKELLPTVEGYQRVWVILSHEGENANLITDKLNEIYNLAFYKKYIGIKIYLFE